jgi:apolipoprotein N-acyltransferase
VKPRVFLPAVTSGVLLWAAFFPLDLGPLGFVALVPWLTLCRAPVSNRRRYFAAYVGGFAFFALATQWVRVAHPMMYLSWLGLAVVIPLFWLVALAILRQLDRLGVPLAIAVPVAWVALEYCRMHFPTGYPFMKYIGAYQMIGFGWYFLGYTQHAVPQLIQIADLGGVYAVSFVVASVNGVLVSVAMQLPAVRRVLRWGEAQEPCCPKKLALGGGVAFGLLAVSIGYGFYRLDHAAFEPGPVVSAIQGSVPQDDKMGDPRGLFRTYADLHLYAASVPQTPDLIVWPETCCPLDWCDVVPGARIESAPSGFGQLRAKTADEFLRVGGWNTSVLFGLNGLEWDGERVWKYNSALLIKPLTRPEPKLSKADDPILHRSAAVGRYDKMHLVPFGEYVPLGEQLPFMRWFTPYQKGYECRPGEKWMRFPLTARDGRDFTFGCLICYEDSDPYLARQYVASQPVNFFVNISNDGWFDGTEEHEEHLAICRFRAIETRRSVVRSVNMGISAVIDPDGRVVALPHAVVARESVKVTRDGVIVEQDKLTLNEQPQHGWTESKKIEGVVTAAVPIDTRAPPYATLGDWIPAACWAVAALALVVGFVRRMVPGSAGDPLPPRGGNLPPAQATLRSAPVNSQS